MRARKRNGLGEGLSHSQNGSAQAILSLRCLLPPSIPSSFLYFLFRKNGMDSTFPSLPYSPPLLLFPSLCCWMGRWRMKKMIVHLLPHEEETRFAESLDGTNRFAARHSERRWYAPSFVSSFPPFFGRMVPSFHRHTQLRSSLHTYLSHSIHPSIPPSLWSFCCLLPFSLSPSLSPGRPPEEEP